MPRLRLVPLTFEHDSIVSPSYYLENWCCKCQNKMEIQCPEGLSTRLGLSEYLCVKPKAVGTYELCDGIEVPELLNITITPFRGLQGYNHLNSTCTADNNISSVWLPSTISVPMSKFRSREDNPDDPLIMEGALGQNFIGYKGYITLAGIEQKLVCYLFLNCVNNCDIDLMPTIFSACESICIDVESCVSIRLYIVNQIYENDIETAGNHENVIIAYTMNSGGTTLYDFFTYEDFVYYEKDYTTCGNEMSAYSSFIFGNQPNGLINTTIYYTPSNPPSTHNDYTIITNNESLLALVYENDPGPQPGNFTSRRITTNYSLILTE